MTAEEIVRLLVEELDDQGRQFSPQDIWSHVGDVTYCQLSNPLKRAAKEWVRLNGTGA